MADFLAGQTLTALHFTPTVEAHSNSQFGFNSTTFGVDADSGVYEEVGVAFVAPFTGRVRIHTYASLDRDTAATFTSCAPVIRTGATVGTGTVILSASEDNGVFHFGTDAAQFGRDAFLDGLTPGSSYNVRLEHRVGGGGGTGTMDRRGVIVSPAT